MSITNMPINNTMTRVETAQEGQGRWFHSACRLVAVCCFLWFCDSFAYGRSQSSPSVPVANEQAKERVVVPISGVRIPEDLELVNQDGHKVRFYSDLVKDKVVAMNFIFTSCTTVCPPLTANFAEFQRQMGDRVGKDVVMISITLDPVSDTPQRLKAWAQKFGAKPGWTFLTGEKQTIDKLLKGLKVFTPLKEDHSPIVLIGDEGQGQWTRVNGLAPPSKFVEVVEGLSGEGQKQQTEHHEETGGREASSDISTGEGGAQETVSSAPINAPALNYFTDTPLVDQHGKTRRFYSDLIKGKSVVITCFFSECSAVCPAVNQSIQAIQEVLGERLGKDVSMISISVDPVTDTPLRLEAYAKQNQAKDGWYFLTGKKENVELILSKLGYSVETREQHSNLILVGNDKTGLWKKAFSLAKAKELIQIVEQVIDDKG